MEENTIKVFRVIIAGTRYFNDYSLLKETSDRLLADKITAGYSIVIVSGGCAGADLLGERYAKENGYSIDRYPAEWQKYGRKAGIMRNAVMADNADALIAYWDGISRGTKNMIDEARKKGLAVRVKRYENPDYHRG